MHDTVVLTSACRKDEDISKTFIGVFAADEVPRKRPQNSCFIMNTDVASLPGTHWVAVYENGAQREFFDSYGQKPSYYNPKLWKKFDCYDRNKDDLQQQTSDVCGDWCIFFLKERSDNTSFKAFLNKFRPGDQEYNDTQVYEIIHREFPLTLMEESHYSIVNQGARSRVAKSLKRKLGTMFL